MEHFRVGDTFSFFWQLGTTQPLQKNLQPTEYLEKFVDSFWKCDHKALSVPMFTLYTLESSSSSRVFVVRLLHAEL